MIFAASMLAEQRSRVHTSFPDADLMRQGDLPPFSRVGFLHRAAPADRSPE